MAINTQKFLPSSKGGAIVKTNKIAVKGSSSLVLSENSVKNIGVIKVKVIEIDSILKGTLASEKKKLNEAKKQESSKRREKIEEKLETKPKAESGKVKTPSAPRMGFLDWIKNFIGNIILGYFAVRLVDHLPKIIPIVKFLGKATDFVLDLGGKLLNGLVTFVDWGYKAYDATRGFVKNLFGDSGVKQFDQLSSLLNKFLNLAIIAGMVAASSGGGGGGGGRRGGGGANTRPGTGGRPRVTTSGGGRAGGIDIRNPFRERPTITQGQGGRGGFRLPFGGARITQGQGGRGGFRFPKLPSLPKLPSGSSKFMGVLGKSFGFIALVPAAFEVMNLLKEGRYKDASRTIVTAGLSMAVFNWVFGSTGAAAVAEAVFSGGTLTPAAIATLLGGTVLATGASMATSAGSDALLRKLGLEDKPKGMRGGGVTRGGKATGGVKRTISVGKKGKYKRKLSPKKPGDVQIEPGADVGGEEKIFGIFPKPKLPGFMNPFGVIENAGKELGKSDYFGPILAITSKILLGQKPTQQDYKNVGLGINMLVAKGIDDGKLKGGLAAFAEGGFVDPKTLDAISQGGDISDWVAASFKDATETNAQKTLREIQENLRLKGAGYKDKEGEAPPTDSGGTSIEGAELSGSIAQKAFQLAKIVQSKFGLKDFQAAAIVGTWMREGFGSGYPDVKEGGRRGAPRYNASRTEGYGFAQWTNTEGGGPNDRLNRALILLGMKDNPRPWTVDDNLKVFEWETKRYYSSLWPALKKTTNLKDAVRTFVGIYEAGGMSQISRYEGQEGGGFIDRRLSSAQGVLRTLQTGKDISGNVLKSADIAEGSSGFLGAGVKGGSLRTGPSQYIGGSTAYHIDTKFHKSLGMGNMVSAMDKLANAYSARGRKIEFSNPGVSGAVWNPNASNADKRSLLQRAFDAHSHSSFMRAEGFLPFDYYNPKKDDTRFGKSVEGSEILLPTFGGKVDVGTKYGGYGKSAEIFSGNKMVAMTGHGDTRYEKGGPTLSRPHMAMLGEKGKEFVIDADSTAAVEKTFPGFLGALNTAKYDQAINVLRNFAYYEFGSEQIVVVPQMQVSDTGDTSYSSLGSSLVMRGGGEDPFESLVIGS